MGIKFTRIKQIGIFSIISIVLLSFGLLVYIQNITERDVKDNLFLQQKQRQVALTKNISLRIGSDLNLVGAMLDGLVNSIYLQRGDFYGEDTKKLVGEKYSQFENVIDGIFVLDKKNIVTIGYSPPGSENKTGTDYSFRDWVMVTRLSLKPVFSDGFETQGTYTIFISRPIIDRSTGSYLGMVAASIPSISYFEHYGDLENINAQFLVVYNQYGIMVANGLNRTFVGENFFGDYTQQFIHYNPILNNLTRNLLAGNPGSAVYDYGTGQRLTTDYPIYVNGKPTYFIQIVTPTTEITSQVHGLLSTEDAKMFMLLGCTLAAISVLVIVLVKWNSSLAIEVNKRTKELEQANEQLKVHDKMQKEFINIAAHELKTPIQPIIGLSEILRTNRDRGGREILLGSFEAGTERKQDEFLEIILRNARRLRRLTDNILDVTRIESRSLFMNKEKFNLSKLVRETIADFRTQISKENKDIKIEFISSGTSTEDGAENDLFVEADKERINQVISNLLSNAMKFTKKGVITVTVETKQSQKTLGSGDDASRLGVVVSIKDTGIGIDPEIIPKLFTKFATKAHTGTGLGLFISKSIIETHGGQIWVEENGATGATFSFSLPIGK